jgi:polysaccharide export outer membrane protein
MLWTRSVQLARIALLMLAVVAVCLGGCRLRAGPGLRGLDSALSTPAPLPPPGQPLPINAGYAPPGVPVVPNEAYTLDSGDRVRVIVFGQNNLSGVFGVSGTGAIAMPLIGTVRARGLTTVQLASRISRDLSRKFIKDPNVTVEVETHRPFYILGEVNRPGKYPYDDAMTVEAAVAVAEGFTERAKLRFVRLTRRFGGVNSTVMVPADYPVRPGDTIYVLERFF